MKNTIESETKLHVKRDALGDIDMGGHFISNIHDSDTEIDATNLRSVKLLLAGTRGNIGKIRTDVDMNNNKLVNIGAPINNTDTEGLC